MNTGYVNIFFFAAPLTKAPQGRLLMKANDELVKFMSFCNFKKEYLLSASEVAIRNEILRKYSEYINNT